MHVRPPARLALVYKTTYACSHYVNILSYMNLFHPLIYIKTLLDPFIASFVSPFLGRLRHSVDVLLFNPPYVPTPPSEASAAQNMTGGAGIAGAWAGGTDGMQVTNQFLGLVDVNIPQHPSLLYQLKICWKDLLAPRGLFYLVAVAPNNISNIVSRMKESYGLKSHVRGLKIIAFCAYE